MEKKRSVFGRLAALALAAVLLCSLVLSGCGSQPAGDETQTSDQSQQTAEGVNVNYGLSNPWDSLMPYYSVSGSNYSRIIYDKIYDRLAYVQPDGTCLPRAAEKWESTEDGHAIVFTLNQKAAFHDGTPVTAQHWVETFQLITDPACEILGKTALSCLTGTDDTGAAVAGETLGVEAVDDYTLKLSFKQPTIPEEFLVDKNRDIYVLPTYLLKDIPADQVVESDFWRKPIGSGPCPVRLRGLRQQSGAGGQQGLSAGRPRLRYPDHHRDGQEQSAHRSHLRRPGLLRLRRQRLRGEQGRGRAGGLHRGRGDHPHELL